MIDKQEFYHGVALVRLLTDARCQKVKKHDFGYIINNAVFVFLKYTTKSRSPWGFTFDQEDVDRCLMMAVQYQKVILCLICGGDGVCGLDWAEANKLLASRPGRIAVSRKHNHSYAAWGSAGELKYKIAVNHWPASVFEFEMDEKIEDNINN